MNLGTDFEAEPSITAPTYKKFNVRFILWNQDRESHFPQALRAEVRTLQATVDIIHSLTSRSQPPVTLQSPIATQPRPTVQPSPEPERVRTVSSPETDRASSPEDSRFEARELFELGQRMIGTRTPTPESPSSSSSPVYPRPLLPHMSSQRNYPLPSPRSFFNLNPTTSYSAGQRSSSSSASTTAPPVLSLASPSDFTFNMGIRP